MPEKSVNGETVYFEERGSGQPVVLLHGFPLDHRIWDAQVESLSETNRVIAPDLPGFGKSKSSEPFTIASLAEGICELLRSIDALPCVLGGLSMGGYVALAFAKKYQSDLRGLMLVDTRAEADTPEGKAGRGRMIETARTSGGKAISDLMMPKMLSEQTANKKSSVVEKLRSIMEACPALTIEYALAAMRDRNDYTGFLPSIAVPTLILVGQHDVITPPAMAKGMNSAIPKSKLVVVPEAGHMSPMENPDAVTTAMRDFVDQIASK